MEKVDRAKLIEQSGSIYKLCNMAAIRAMELNSGMKRLVESEPSDKVTSVALKEISEGKVKLKA